MPNTKEKLVELLCQEYQYATYEDMADGMIANGVTVQEWISVKDERKPKDRKKLFHSLCVWRFRYALLW